METDKLTISNRPSIHPESYYVRPKSKYPPMSNIDRAKQFMPFAALKGFEEAIAAVEQRNIQKNTKEQDC